MTREELILKWLNNDLNAHETKAFEALEDYDALVKMSDSLSQFEAPEYDSYNEFTHIEQRIKPTQHTIKINWYRHAMQIAAILVICFGIYYFTTSQDTTFSTLLAQKSTLELPDNSKVILNADSEISFNDGHWKNERLVSLQGEAYFNVTKGASFTVSTSAGDVTVLGTQFKIKQRDNIFEVVCYEGSVEVTHFNQTKILKAGDNFLIIDGNYIVREKETASNPSWINNESYFKSMPFEFVINEFERQYGLSIETNNIDLNQHFTGSFAHNDKVLALKSITLPLNLSYSIKDNSTIVLSRE